MRPDTTLQQREGSGSTGRAGFPPTLAFTFLVTGSFILCICPTAFSVRALDLGGFTGQTIK